MQTYRFATWAGRRLLPVVLGLAVGGAVAAEREAEDLIGMPVVNAQGEELGEVDDLAIDWRDGRVAYAIVTYGGLFSDQEGFENKLFAVPARALQLGDDRFVLDIDKDKIQESWSFSRFDWPDMEAEDFAARTHDWYELEQTFEEETPEMPLDTQVEEASAEYLKEQATGSMQKASDLDDMEIRDADGESIGEVDDLMVDWEQGQVVRVPVEFGGFLGMGEEEAELPISAMTLKAKEASTPLRFSKDNYLQLNMTKAELEAGEGR